MADTFKKKSMIIGEGDVLALVEKVMLNAKYGPGMEVLGPLCEEGLMTAQPLQRVMDLSHVSGDMNRWFLGLEVVFRLRDVPVARDVIMKHLRRSIINSSPEDVSDRGWTYKKVCDYLLELTRPATGTTLERSAAARDLISSTLGMWARRKDWLLAVVDT